MSITARIQRLERTTPAGGLTIVIFGWTSPGEPTFKIVGNCGILHSPDYQAATDEGRQLDIEEIVPDDEPDRDRIIRLILGARKIISFAHAEMPISGDTHEPF